jgi:hypothetical protein
MNDSLADRAAHSARTAACTALAEALTHVGRLLWVGSHVLRERRTEGVALTVEMAAEAATGAALLFDQQLWYAGAGVVRQLIEAQYLVFLFAGDLALAEEWLMADDRSLRKWWSPASMRQRSQRRFQDAEYRVHCEMGGHPVPKGRRLLKDHSFPLDRRSGWADLAQHATAIWRDVETCVKALGYDSELEAPICLAAHNAIAIWEERDPLSRRIVVPIED